MGIQHCSQLFAFLLVRATWIHPQLSRPHFLESVLLLTSQERWWTPSLVRDQKTKPCSQQRSCPRKEHPNSYPCSCWLLKASAQSVPWRVSTGRDVSPSFDFSCGTQRLSIQVVTSWVLMKWYVSKHKQLAQVTQLTLLGCLQSPGLGASENSKDLRQPDTPYMFFPYFLCFSMKSTHVNWSPTKPHGDVDFVHSWSVNKGANGKGCWSHTARRKQQLARGVQLNRGLKKHSAPGTCALFFPGSNNSHFIFLDW